MARRLLARILKIDNNNDGDSPIIRIETEDGTIQFVHNPYYKEKDPSKRILKGEHPNGGGIIRNPIAPSKEELEKEAARLQFLNRMHQLILDDGKIDPILK